MFCARAHICARCAARACSRAKTAAEQARDVMLRYVCVRAQVRSVMRAYSHAYHVMMPLLSLLIQIIRRFAASLRSAKDARLCCMMFSTRCLRHPRRHLPCAMPRMLRVCAPAFYAARCRRERRSCALSPRYARRAAKFRSAQKTR